MIKSFAPCVLDRLTTYENKLSYLFNHSNPPLYEYHHPKAINIKNNFIVPRKRKISHFANSTLQKWRYVVILCRFFHIYMKKKQYLCSRFV